ELSFRPRGAGSSAQPLTQFVEHSRGQRWADTGCDNMIKLRLAYQNNRFDLIQNLLKHAA
ncbi:MAG: hypothetical protein SF053_08785, partial [Bacteroidia bacterium]|nr:hypothetical protein [Bacteroidia bacterium]